MSTAVVQIDNLEYRGIIKFKYQSVQLKYSSSCLLIFYNNVKYVLEYQ
jgi:hypothetical protein